MCHFDISLENFLINGVQTEHIKASKQIRFVNLESVQIKLCDFGLAEYFETEQNFLSNKYCGKIGYQSPEINHKKKGFNAASNDIWCLGVVLFSLSIGTAPWRRAHESDTMFMYIINGQIDKLLTVWNKMHYVDWNWIDLISSIFQYEDKRVDIKAIKEHLKYY